MDVALGTITLPSGTLAVFDVGVVALVQAGHVPVLPLVLVPGLPRDRGLAVVARPVSDVVPNVVPDAVPAVVPDAAPAGPWDHVVVQVGAGDVARSEHMGDVVVDFARVLFIDDEARAQWNHDGSIDGRADYVFWGRDAAALAAVVGAPALPEDSGMFGWIDGLLDEVVAAGRRAEAERAARGLRLATDFRPHSHHWQALAAVRRSPHDAGVVDVGGARACLWMTSWGDGVFPVFRDVAADGALVQVRVQLRADLPDERGDPDPPTP